MGAGRRQLFAGKPMQSDHLARHTPVSGRPAAVPRLVRLEPPPRVRLTPLEGGGAPVDVEARALHERAVLLAAPISLPAGTRCRLELRSGEARFEATGRIEAPAAAGEGPIVALEPLDGDAHRALERFLTRFRKADHIRICRDEEVACTGITNGFERWRLPHEALPELDKRTIDLRTTLFGRPLAAPLLISCMTGGSELAKQVNERLARVAQRFGIALGLGSQRALLADPRLLDTYAVRPLCPDVPLFANLGAVQLNYGLGLEDCRRALDMVEADALVLHLNPLQEAVQPEGDVDFRGLKDKIAAVAQALEAPVLLKEVGSGLGPRLARWAAATRLAGLDTAGAGGTSWARVESYRAGDPRLAALGRAFGGWGIPTAESVIACRAALGPERLVIASGGIRNGIEVAKAIALGADLVGVARPFLAAATQSEQALAETAEQLIEELRVAMFCCGAGSIAALKRTELEPVAR